MKTLLPVLLILLTLTWGCDSDDPATAQLEGRYSGGESAEFTTTSGAEFINFDITLDIDPPGASGAFMGDATIARGAVGNAAAITGRGTVSGTLNGSAISFSAIASDFASRHATGRRAGNGLRFDAEGTVQSDGAITLEGTILDFAYGRSETFFVVLEK